MSDGRIKDSQIDGIGTTYLSTIPQLARLLRPSAWCLHRHHFLPGRDYLEIDVRNATLTAIAAQGQSMSGVTKYSVKYSVDLSDNPTWYDYTEVNSNKVQVSKNIEWLLNTVKLSC